MSMSMFDPYIPILMSKYNLSFTEASMLNMGRFVLMIFIFIIMYVFFGCLFEIINKFLFWRKSKKHD